MHDVDNAPENELLEEVEEYPEEDVEEADEEEFSVSSLGFDEAEKQEQAQPDAEPNKSESEAGS